MKLLLLDTSTDVFTLAVSDKDRVIAKRKINCLKKLSSVMVPAMEKILKKAGWRLKDLDGFGVGTGPGSFTGLRVGIATVKAMSFALNTPAAGISSLDIIAQAVKEEARHICAVSDARRGLVYAAFYKKTKDVVKRKSDYLLTDAEGLRKEILDETIFIGDGIPVLKEKLMLKKEQLVSEKWWQPQAEHILPLIPKRLKSRGKNSADKLLPLYLYPEDCQVRKA